jgi:hypothetical protein
MWAIAQSGRVFPLTFQAMHTHTENAQLDKLRAAYASALLAFNAASAALIINFAMDMAPSDDLVATEESARAALVGARRQLWAAYTQRQRQAFVTRPAEEKPADHVSNPSPRGNKAGKKRPASGGRESRLNRG